jgi:hypothetical protein
MNITLTVALPLYRAQNIAWLALESLCRQDVIFSYFRWELLIAEEQFDSPLGQAAIETYADRLTLVNCARIEYVPLQSWIPLSEKWRLLGNLASPTSLGFLLQAADCYSHPLRLRNSWELFSSPNPPDWIQARRGYFFDFKSQRTLEFDYQSYPVPSSSRCSLDIGAKTDWFRKVPVSQTRRFVDHWLFQQFTAQKAAPLNVDWTPDSDFHLSLNTSGLNNVSNRDDFFTNPSPPFKPATHFQLMSTVPPPVLAQLLDPKYRDLANQNQKKVWELYPEQNLSK